MSHRTPKRSREDDEYDEEEDDNGGGLWARWSIFSSRKKQKRITSPPSVGSIPRLDLNRRVSSSSTTTTTSPTTSPTSGSNSSLRSIQNEMTQGVTTATAAPMEWKSPVAKDSSLKFAVNLPKYKSKSNNNNNSFPIGKWRGRRRMYYKPESKTLLNSYSSIFKKQKEAATASKPYNTLLAERLLQQNKGIFQQTNSSSTFSSYTNSNPKPSLLSVPTGNPLNSSRSRLPQSVLPNAAVNKKTVTFQSTSGAQLVQQQQQQQLPALSTPAAAPKVRLKRQQTPFQERDPSTNSPTSTVTTSPMSIQNVMSPTASESESSSKIDRKYANQRQIVKSIQSFNDQSACLKNIETDQLQIISYFDNDDDDGDQPTHNGLLRKHADDINIKSLPSKLTLVPDKNPTRVDDTNLQPPENKTITPDDAIQQEGKPSEPKRTRKTSSWGASMFKHMVDKWVCKVCSVRNVMSAVKCVACENPKPSDTDTATPTISNVQKTPAKPPAAAPDQAPATRQSSFSFGSLPNSSATHFTPGSFSSANTPKTDAKKVPSFSQTFKRTLDGEEKQNESTAGTGFSFGAFNGKAESANAPAPKSNDTQGGVAPASDEATSTAAGDSTVKPSPGFSFGSTSNSTSTPKPFSFGAAANGTTGESSFAAPSSTNASGGFSFGAPAPSSNDATPKPSEGFSFQAPSSSADKTATAKTGFSFGAPVSSNDTSATPNTTAGFASGAPPSASAPAFAGASETPAAKETKPSGGFPFGSSSKETQASKPATNFSFGAPVTNDKPKETNGHTNSTSAPESTNSNKFPFQAASSAPIGGFSFGAKPNNATGSENTTVTASAAKQPQESQTPATTSVISGDTKPPAPKVTWGVNSVSTIDAKQPQTQAGETKTGTFQFQPGQFSSGQSTTSQPAFVFGKSPAAAAPAQKPATDSNGTFHFGAGTSTPAPNSSVTPVPQSAFTFGKHTAATPAAGGMPKTPQTAPSSFGQPLFGTTPSTNTPSFGGSSIPAAGNNFATPAPTGFGNPQFAPSTTTKTTPGFQFGGNAPAPATAGAASTGFGSAGFGGGNTNQFGATPSTGGFAPQANAPFSSFGNNPATAPSPAPVAPAGGGFAFGSSSTGGGNNFGMTSPQPSIPGGFSIGTGGSKRGRRRIVRGKRPPPSR